MPRAPTRALLPTLSRAPAAPAAAALVVRGACKGYRIGHTSRSARHVVLREVTLRVEDGERVAIHGGGIGPLTLLRCLAGLATLDAGQLTWCGAAGERAPPPLRALVGAEWRATAECHAVRDVLEAAVPAGWPQERADRGIAWAVDRCGLPGLLQRRANALSPLDRWRVGLAAALVGGARWLLLELPPPTAADDRERRVAVRTALLRLRASAHTLVVSAPPGWGRWVPASRAMRWLPERAGLAPVRRVAAADRVRRVAEPARELGDAALTLARESL